MKNTGATVTGSRTDSERTVPRAVLHKKILDTAGQRPDASMEELAEEISFATTELVERVLEEYGDPGLEDEDEENKDEKKKMVDVTDTTEEEPESSPDEENETTGTTNSTADYKTTVNDSETDSGFGATSLTDNSNDETHAEDELDYTDPIDSDEGAIDHSRDSPTDDSQPDHNSNFKSTDLTEKQGETLKAIQKRPHATQAELAEELDVTSATINQRVNSIDGFDWYNRRAFVETVFGGSETTTEISTNKEANTAEVETESKEDAGKSNAMRDTNDNETIDVESTDNSNIQQCNELTDQLDELSEQVETLEQRLNTKPTSPPVLSDPELAHKVIHACLNSDLVSEEEELQLLKNIVGD